MLRRSRERGFMLNKDKVKGDVTQVKEFGHMLPLNVVDLILIRSVLLKA